MKLFNFQDLKIGTRFRSIIEIILLLFLIAFFINSQKTIEGFLSILIIIVLTIILGIIFLRSIIIPLNDLIIFSQKIIKGNLNARVELKSKDEFGQLADYFNDMTTKLEGSMKMLERRSEVLAERIIELSEEKNKSAAILNSIGDGVFLVDTEERILLMNKVAEDLSGYSLEEAFKKPYSEIFKFIWEKEQNKSYPDFIGKAMREGEIQNLTQILLGKRKGKNISISISAAPVKYSRGETFGCVVVFRNVSKERELERAKDRFLAIASHQLRAPLGSTKWSLEMILGGEFGKLPTKAKELIRQIYKSNDRLINLVNDLLDVSRIDQGKTKNEPKTTDIIKIIKIKIKELSNLAEAKSVNISLEIPKEKIPNILVDPQHFGDQVIQNILTNAILYNRRGGFILVRIVSLNDEVQISVSDKGIGIPEREQDKIFSRFFRASNAAKSEVDGSGLGLYVVKYYIESWGGKIWFESKEGKGTTFYISLPKK